MRIVSLLPSATEIVFALGLGDQLEAVTYECDHPSEARSKPVVSESALPQDRPLRPGEIDALVGELMGRKEPLYRLDRDLLRKIQPDLILTQDLCRVCAVPTGLVQDALDELELGTSSRVVSLDPHTLQDVLESILTVGRATGTEDRAAEVVQDLRARIERVRRTALRLPSIRTLCLEWIDPPWVAGHWVPEMVEIAGGTNLLNEPGLPSRTCLAGRGRGQPRDRRAHALRLLPAGGRGAGREPVRRPRLRRDPGRPGRGGVRGGRHLVLLTARPSDR
jgi:iron complex transport system substrate-binding protein